MKIITEEEYNALKLENDKLIKELSNALQIIYELRKLYGVKDAYKIEGEDANL